MTKRLQALFGLVPILIHVDVHELTGVEYIGVSTGVQGVLSNLTTGKGVGFGVQSTAGHPAVRFRRALVHRVCGTAYDDGYAGLLDGFGVYVHIVHVIEAAMEGDVSLRPQLTHHR